VLLGGLAEPHRVLAVALVACWGFIAGLLTSLGSAGMRVGLNGMILLIVLGEQPRSTDQVLLASGAVLAGAVVQTLLATAPWPIRGYDPERRALAAAYRRLADVHPDGDDPSAPTYGLILEAHHALTDLDPQRNRAAATLRILLDELERARNEAVALANLALRLRQAEDDESAAAADEVDRMLAAADTVATGIADRLEHGRSRTAPAVGGLDELAATVAVLRRRADRTGPKPLTRRGAATRAAALNGQLRAAYRLTQPHSEPDPVRPGDAAELPTGPLFVMPADEPGTVLRANLRPSSAAFRHAVRLAVTLAVVASALAVAGLPRGYWLLLTVAVAIRPDFAATVKQVIDRVAGTLVGMVVVSALLEWVVPRPWQQLVLVPVCYFLLRTVLTANFALGAAAMAGNAVLVATLLGAPTGSLILERIGYTLAAGVIALVAYLVWPTWERATVRDTLALALESARSYLLAVTDPESGPGDIGAARSAARVALANARDSAKRLATEPGTAPELVDLVKGGVVHCSRLVQGGIVLEAARAARPGSVRHPALAAFARDLDTSVGELTAALRAGRPIVEPWPPSARLRADVETLISVAPDARLATVATAADRLTDGLGTLAHLLSRLPAGDDRPGSPAIRDRHG
jgi:uncharacterized membrane protein YccC